MAKRLIIIFSVLSLIVLTRVAYLKFENIRSLAKQSCILSIQDQIVKIQYPMVANKTAQDKCLDHEEKKELFESVINIDRLDCSSFDSKEVILSLEICTTTSETTNNRLLVKMPK